MKTLRTYGIIVAVALVAIGLALLPSAEETPPARPGITVGGTAPAGPASRDADAASTDAPSADGAAVALPTVPESSADGPGTDIGVGTMEPEASPSPAPAPAPAPAPQRPRSSSAPSDSSSSGGDQSAGRRPSGVCEWDDGELRCEDDDHDHDHHDDHDHHHDDEDEDEDD
ncbi:hypothetical protein CFK38_01205 [Brachybacterium vulturis]|uniref:Uncharacterized protein n=1 Tax=Brachybacterium vulturis TaxID=2017484 RepID=A0A291GJA3_9MICO|nr:hypothetical protein [Brachybacterium vulturis]ATG50291.1 hypothetical protein CFK38_01205 [Brachybacterium vulturis]